MASCSCGCLFDTPPRQRCEAHTVRSRLRCGSTRRRTGPPSTPSSSAPSSSATSRRSASRDFRQARHARRGSPTRPGTPAAPASGDKAAFPPAAARSRPRCDAPSSAKYDPNQGKSCQSRHYLTTLPCPWEFSIVLTARAVGGQPTPSSESSEVRWVPAAEIPGYAMDLSMRIRINNFLARHKYTRSSSRPTPPRPRQAVLPVGREETICNAGSANSPVGLPRPGNPRNQCQTKCQRPRIPPDPARCPQILLPP